MEAFTRLPDYRIRIVNGIFVFGTPGSAVVTILAGRTFREAHSWQSGGGVIMQDLIFIALTIAFFGVAIGYVRFCDRMR